MSLCSLFCVVRKKGQIGHLHGHTSPLLYIKHYPFVLLNVLMEGIFAAMPLLWLDAQID